LNCERPELQSNLFFWQQSDLPAADVLVTFSLVVDPLDDAKMAELERAGLRGVALSPRAAAAQRAPMFWPRTMPSRRRAGRLDGWRGPALEARILAREVSRYRERHAFWHQVFDAFNVRLYTTWYRNGSDLCAISDALESLGGIGTVYQRSYEEFPSPDAMVPIDVLFGFSRLGAEVERKSGSRIPYYVVTGYNGDHRFPLLRPGAIAIRERLQAAGARRILAFMDENSVDDARWSVGHERMRADYAFLLEQVIRDPSFGLILKPKAPRTLRRRLGPLADLLTQALATSRCHIFEAGLVQSAYPPAAAGLGADLVVHSHLWAATAGVETALAGVRTVLLDRDGIRTSRFRSLGLGRIVFERWDDLWTSWSDVSQKARADSCLGDWTPLLNDLDPFRDGRAAERTGTYLKWLLDGLNDGLGRETVLADAAERYGKAWGADKVVAVGGCDS
jgi:hypothetical protein